MKKCVCIALSLLMLMSLSACTAGGESKDVDLAALESDMLGALGIATPLTLDSDALLNQYGIQPEDIADLACFVTLDGAFPQEIVMVKATDTAAAGRVKEHLQTRLSEFRVQSRDYDAENYAIAQKCDIHSAGVYVAMFLTPDYEQLSTMFESAVK